MSFTWKRKEISAEPEGSWRYLNSGVKSAIKVIIGFIPAFLTFALTKDWWFLAYCGAFIWFGITGLRNILQSVLGGGGFRRSPLLRWNDYVSWERLADSLLFTGFSVPLLDYIVKTVFLDRMFGVTTATNPTLLYTVMALANGLYLSSHNAFRGLPKGAIVGNFFRTVISIPLAVAFNALIGGILSESDIQKVDDILEKWAASSPRPLPTVSPASSKASPTVTIISVSGSGITPRSSVSFSTPTRVLKFYSPRRTSFRCSNRRRNSSRRSAPRRRIWNGPSSSTPSISSTSGCTNPAPGVF